jgi:hypothetical protein
MTPSARWVLAAAGACAAVGLPGCGDDGAEPQTSGARPPKPPPRPLDVTPHERELRKALYSTGSSVPTAGPLGRVETQTTPGTKVTEVDCPDDVIPKKGAVFNCTIRGKQHLRGNVRITLRDKSGDRFRFRARMKTKFITRTLRGNTNLRAPQIVGQP